MYTPVPVLRSTIVWAVALFCGSLAFASDELVSLESKLVAGLQAIETEGANLERLRSVGLLYEELADLENAAKYLYFASKEAGSSAEQISDLARVYVKAGKAEGALLLLKDGIVSFPKSGELLYTQGMVYLAIDKVPAATYALQRAVKLEPENPNYNYKLAEVMFLRGNLEKSEALLEPMMESDDVLEDAVLLYGQVLFSSDRERQGLRVIERYFKKNPGNEKVRGTLVSLLLKNSMAETDAGRISRAVKLLEDANEIVPAEPKILMGLVLLENEQGNPTKAIEYCNDILGTYPEDLQALAFLGRIQRVEGLAAEAEATFKRGLEIAERKRDRAFIADFERLLNPFE